MKIIIFIFLLMAVIFISEIYIPEDKLNDTEQTSKVLINYKLFADERNSSFIPGNCKFSGNIIWERKSTYINNLSTPINLAISDSILIIWYMDKIDITDKLNGKSIWNEEIMPNANFDLKSDGVVTMNSAGLYEVKGLDQKLKEEYSLPFLNSKTKLFFSEKIKNKIYYVYQNIPVPTNSPDDIFSEPEFIFANFNLSSDDFDWQFIKKELLICALKIQTNNRICIVSTKNIYLFDMNSTSEKKVQSLSFENILSASLDFQDNMLIINENDNGRELRCLNQSGKTNWVYPLENAILTGQPPASHPDGNVYIVTDNNLKCIHEGNVFWSFSMPVQPGKALITILKDKSVLVAAGNTLMQISEEGKLVQQKYFNYPLTCRPIIDGDENIYVANQESIYAIK